jgi:integrase
MARDAKRTIRFTTRNIGALPVPSKPEQLDYFDRELAGFGIRVSYGGRRTWFTMYRHARTRRRMTLGTYPAVTLAEARKKAMSVIGQASDGKDPAGERRALLDVGTVKQLVDRYIEDYAKEHKRSWKNDKRMLEQEIVPTLGRLRLPDVTRRDVKAVIKAITKRGAPIVANRTHEVVRKMFNYAIDEEMIAANPAARIQRNVESSRERVLVNDEIRSLWAALGAEKTAVAAVLRLLLVTAQREGEVSTMRWSDIDFEGRWWTIPAERAKNGLAHRIYLSDQALDILDPLRRKPKDKTWVFPRRVGVGPATRNLISRPLLNIRKTAKLGDVRPHDLRRTAASLMTGMGISRLTVSKILNHIEGGVTAVYDRHSYDPEKKLALEAWGQRLDAIIAGKQEAGNVVELQRA